MDQSVRAPNPVDAHVGGRVRMRRTLLGMTQTSLGEAIGLTFQQVQKYERGINRIGSSRLYDLARVLDVPVNFFFDDMPTAIAGKSPARVGGAAETVGRFDLDLVGKRETLELMRSYYRISNPKIRKRLFEMVKALGAASKTQR